MTKDLRIEPHLYMFVEEIGEGGFGRVFKGHEIFNHDDLVAIKVLRPEQLDELSKERFSREIKIHSQLKHKNIVAIINFELDDSIPEDLVEGNEGLTYYTMPLALKNLRKFLVQYREENIRRMDDETTIYYFNQILDGIEHAHKEGIIHRDLKPENILVYEEEGIEILKISDFGLGKFLNSETNLTRTQMALGSDVYAAPEQYHDSRQVDETADIYSLGKILYELLTYDLPVSIDFNKISDSKLKYVVRKATQTDKDKRFRSIEEMKDKINMVMGYTNTLKSISSQFNNLYEKYTQDFEHSYLKEIADLLMKNNEDYILYTENFMTMDETDFQVMSAFYLEEFYEIAENYFSLIKGDHLFSFTDKIANFIFYDLMSIIKENLDLYELAIERVLILAYSHNRYYIAELFAEEISKEEDDNLIMVIGDVLESNPILTRWIKPYFSKFQLCEYLRNLLNEF
ncbi:serine/threonine-protein kinase [Priestia megaterium]|uniref:serine/threonine-protein kinase n=1 Tax=Priestia megaterium TaxID=1404 RepID=UPI0035B5819E